MSASRDYLDRSDGSLLRLVSLGLAAVTDDDDDDEEEDDLFCVLFLSSVALTFRGPYTAHFRFDISCYDPGEQNHHFRFYFEHVQRIVHLLLLPTTLHTDNRTSISAIEAVLIVLKCLAFPSRWRDLAPFFGRGDAELSSIFNYTLQEIVTHWLPLLRGQNVLFQLDRIRCYADAIMLKIGYPECGILALWMDSSVHRLGLLNMRTFCLTGMRCVGWKFQNFSLPDGMIGHAFRPCEGVRGDSIMLYRSQLIPLFDRILPPLITPDGHRHRHYCGYGDSAYPVLTRLLGPSTLRLCHSRRHLMMR